MIKKEIEPKTALAARLRQIRKVTGDKERGAFAKIIGVKRNTLANYEIGATEPPASVILAYHTNFSVSYNWLFSGEGKMFTEEKQSEEQLPGERDINREQLAVAIETVEEALHRANKRPSPIKKAELIQIAYAIIKDEHDISKIIRLVSAA